MRRKFLIEARKPLRLSLPGRHRLLRDRHIPATEKARPIERERIVDGGLRLRQKVELFARVDVAIVGVGEVARQF